VSFSARLCSAISVPLTSFSTAKLAGQYTGVGGGTLPGSPSAAPLNGRSRWFSCGSKMPAGFAALTPSGEDESYSLAFHRRRLATKTLCVAARRSLAAIAMFS